MSRETFEWKPLSSAEMTHYLNEARRERAEVMAQLMSRAGTWVRSRLGGNRDRRTAPQGVAMGHMAARGR